MVLTLDALLQRAETTWQYIFASCFFWFGYMALSTRWQDDHSIRDNRSHAKPLRRTTQHERDAISEISVHFTGFLAVIVFSLCAHRCLARYFEFTM